MAGRQHQLAKLATDLGLTRLLELVPRRPSLLILNYHRIGDATATPFDSGVFSCTAQELEEQVLYLQRQFRVVNLPDALDLLDGRRPLRDPTVLLSFDDGYLDNYQLAFPVLARHGVPAVFFLPTAFIGTGQLPWWDNIASIIKRTHRPTISLRFAPNRTFDLSPPHHEDSIWQLLELYKHSSVTDGERFLVDLEEACGVSRTSETTTPLFLSWAQARQMQAAGMHFGSHTHTHRILSKLPFPEQHQELQVSRDILQAELGAPMDLFAYPVGDRSSFNADTFRALAETGYRHAFSFISGVNRPRLAKPAHPWAIPRIGVFSGSLSTLRLQSSLQALSAGLAFAPSPPHIPLVSPRVTTMIDGASDARRHSVPKQNAANSTPDGAT